MDEQTYKIFTDDPRFALVPELFRVELWDKDLCWATPTGFVSVQKAEQYIEEKIKTRACIKRRRAAKDFD